MGRQQKQPSNLLNHWATMITALAALITALTSLIVKFLG